MTALDPSEIKKQLHELNQERKEVSGICATNATCTQPTRHQVNERLKNTDRLGRQIGGVRNNADAAEPPPGPSLFDRIARNGGARSEEGELHSKSHRRGGDPQPAVRYGGRTCRTPLV